MLSENRRRFCERFQAASKVASALPDYSPSPLQLCRHLQTKKKKQYSRTVWVGESSAVFGPHDDPQSLVRGMR